MTKPKVHPDWRPDGKHIRCCSKCHDEMLKLTQKGFERLSRRSKRKPLVCVFCGRPLLLSEMELDVLKRPKDKEQK